LFNSREKSIGRRWLEHDGFWGGRAAVLQGGIFDALERDLPTLHRGRYLDKHSRSPGAKARPYQAAEGAQGGVPSLGKELSKAPGHTIARLILERTDHRG